jgi:hypothetical protein
MRWALLQQAGKAGAKAALCALAACASVPPPHPQVGAARAMVSQAEQTAARDAPLELSTAQAKLARGNDARRIEARGYGPAYPVASNDTPVGRQLNRRVQVVIATNSQ